MSANMFAKTPPKLTDSKTKIPVPSSPSPMRRYGSLRLKGEKFPSFPADSQANNRSGRFPAENAQSSVDAPLTRGGSFMERGEQRAGNNGGRNFATSSVSRRPENVKIDSRSPVGSLRGPASPQSPARIRSLSLSLSTTRLQNSPKSPKVLTSSPNNTTPSVIRNFSTSNLDRWDTESITSTGSSVASCEHASVARNGTTFSGRSMKYVFHCNQHAGVAGEDYLTPTQRAQRQVKKLKYLLQQAKKELEEKDSDILKLTKEVVELRLYKAALNSPEDKSNSSDAITVRENASEETTPQDIVDGAVSIQITNEFNSSYADSGHFDDCASSSVHSKDSMLCDDDRSPEKIKRVDTSDKATSANLGVSDHDEEHSKLIMEYERRLQELVRTHEEESYQLKQKHNDKVEELLQRITEINSRYWQLVPELETAKERIKELEQQLEEASKKLEEQEEKSKGSGAKTNSDEQKSTRMESEKVAVELAHQNPNRITVPELLQELQVTKNELDNIRDVEYASTSKNSQPLLSAKEALSLWVLGARKAMYRQLMEAKSKNKIDPEITLQFLKSAVYYFLTDKENTHGHLRAIQSILGFSSNEILNIDKARST